MGVSGGEAAGLAVSRPNYAPEAVWGDLALHCVDSRRQPGLALQSVPMSPNQVTGVPDPLLELRDALRQFAADRDWDQFHSPKNLAMALTVEAAELLELGRTTVHSMWLSTQVIRCIQITRIEKI